MKLLRIFLILYAFVYVLGGIIIFRNAKGGWNFFLALYLLVNAIAILAGTLFEQTRYKTDNVSKTGLPRRTSLDGWQVTNERFIDQSTGKLMEVHYNPQTGERKYVEVDLKNKI